MSLDDIAQRVQRIIDDPTREADETDPRILQALEDRRAAEQTERPADREADEARRLAENPRHRKNGNPRAAPKRKLKNSTAPLATRK